MIRFVLPIIQVIFLFSVTACGFRPVYTANTDSIHTSAVRESLTQIEVMPIPDKIGVDLRNALIDKLYQHGNPTTPLYRLNITVTDLRISETGIARDATTIREQLKLIVNAQLIDTTTQQPSFNRDFTSLTNYNILSSEYATIVAREDAQKRAVNEVSEDIIRRLSLYLSGS